MHVFAIGADNLFGGSKMLEEFLRQFGIQQRRSWSRGSMYRLGDVLFVHTGDVPAIAARLRAAGHQVEVLAASPRKARLVSVPAALAPWEHDLAHAIREYDQGQIVATADCVRDSIACISRGNPKDNILVVSMNLASAKQIASNLRRRCPRRVSIGQNVPWNQRPLVHVDVLSGLDRTAHDWPTLVFADVESARSNTGMLQAASMPDSRIYAVRTPDRKLDWEDELRLRITCGREIFRINGKPFTDTTVTVVPIRALRSRKKLLNSPLANKRRQWWHNSKVNQQIASLAKSMSTKDTSTLHKLGIPVSAINQQLTEIGERPRVAVLVESAEHARAIRRLLPGWPTRNGRCLASRAYPTLPLDCDRVIVTRARALAAGLSADVVIRADGPGTDWRDDYGPHYGFNGDTMLIVDLQGAFDRVSRRRSASRIEDYRSRGWTVVCGETAVAGDSSDGLQAVAAVGTNETNA